MSRPGQDAAAEAFAAIEVAAGLRAGVVDRAEARRPIERHAGAVALLIQATHAGVLDDKYLRHHITRAEFNHQVAAAAAAGARGEIGMLGQQGTDNGGPRGYSSESSPGSGVAITVESGRRG